MFKRILLANAVILLILTIPVHADSFIRVDEDDSAARLQTAVTRYEKDGVVVDLIGTVHIADKSYYESLNERFKTYDALLFEMIGGEGLAEAKDGIVVPEDLAAPAKTKDFSGLGKIYGMVAGFLNLSGQKEGIDYTPENFVHADLTLQEFSEKQAERKESLLGFALKMAMTAPESANAPDPDKLMEAVLSGKSELVKLEIVHTLGQGDDLIAAFMGESVIISDRNQRCIEVLNRKIDGGKKILGIFYGAAHFPDLEKRLIELGFERGKQEWMTAWDIPKPQQELTLDEEEATN